MVATESRIEEILSSMSGYYMTMASEIGLATRCESWGTDAGYRLKSAEWVGIKLKTACQAIRASLSGKKTWISGSRQANTARIAVGVWIEQFNNLINGKAVTGYWGDLPRVVGGAGHNAILSSMRMVMQSAAATLQMGTGEYHQIDRALCLLWTHNKEQAKSFYDGMNSRTEDGLDHVEDFKKTRWVTEDVRGLARRIVQDDRTELFPILADAMQDAGFTHEPILNLFRSGNTVPAACWALVFAAYKK